MSRPAIVLLSGGLDSAVTLAVAKSLGFLPYALSFRYGQRHDVEVLAAQRIAAAQVVCRHTIVDIDLRVFGGSALTDALEVPKHERVEDLPGAGIPVTYVPARNTIFLSFALAYAEVVGAGDVFIGVNALDCSGYPDCRPEYIAAYEAMADLATRAGIDGAGVKIHAPLIGLSKAEIIREGSRLGVDYGSTSSCYDPDETGTACGHCAACLLRLQGFAGAGIPDPVAYQATRP